MPSKFVQTFSFIYQHPKRTIAFCIYVLMLCGVVISCENRKSDTPTPNQNPTNTAPVLRLYQNTNTQRVSNGSPTLAEEAVLNAAAVQYAQAWANRQLLPGDSLESRLNTLRSKMSISNFGETWFSGAVPDAAVADTALSLWLQNAKDRTVLFGDFNRTGIGFYRAADSTAYLVQLYAKVP